MGKILDKKKCQPDEMSVNIYESNYAFDDHQFCIIRQQFQHFFQIINLKFAESSALQHFWSNIDHSLGILFGKISSSNFLTNSLLLWVPESLINIFTNSND